MTANEEFRKHCIDTIEKYPSLKGEVNRLYFLFKMEIEDDFASEEHDSELPTVLQFLYRCIEELIKDLNHE